MKQGKFLLTGLMTAAAVVVSGCGIAPVEKGQQITLGPNQGIAAVVMDSLDHLTQISIDSTEKDGPTLKITDVPVGVTTHVFVVPAGHYCVTNYWLGSNLIYLKDQTHGVCFDVLPGKIAYSGNIAPRAYGPNDLRTDQNYDWQDFQKRLKDEYPDLAAKYPVVTP